jgi:hypothetical protein
MPTETLNERDRVGDADPAPELRPDQHGREFIEQVASVGIEEEVTA